jgi:hypothetical protein
MDAVIGIGPSTASAESESVFVVRRKLQNLLPLIERKANYSSKAVVSAVDFV